MSKIAAAVFNRKGGVGKSTLSVILAEIALVRHNKVLAVDLDPSHNFTDALNFMKNYFHENLRIQSGLEESDADAPEDWIVIDCPPRLGSNASGLSFAMICSTLLTFKGSIYVMSAISGSVMIVAGFELTRTIS